MTPSLPPPPDRVARLEALERALAARILVLDGATGTALQARNLSAADFGGAALEGCNENLVRTRPDVVAAVHDAYLEAGADIVETNTFGATPLVLDEYGLGAFAREINRDAARIARAACARVESPERPRWVAGSMGPTTKALSVTGGATFEELVGHFREQALGLVEGGADYLLLETCQDTRNVKAGLLGVQAAFEALGVRIPVAVSATIEPTGTMLAGQDVEALAVSLAHHDLLYLGLNCATGPAFMTDHVRTLAARTRARVACVPNAGLPDEDGCYGESPEHVASVLTRFAEHGWLNLVGGCCGTTAAHVRSLVAAMARRAPRVAPHGPRGTWLAGVEAVEVTEDLRPVIVGERTNVLGSRKFKRLVKEKRWDEAVEIGRAQVKGGAHLIDVCLQDPDADELAGMRAFLDRLTRAVRVPLVIDTTDARVMEEALTYCQGKALLNSVNLEDGLERFERVVPLARRFGAALVVGLIDDDPQQGMAVTVERKLEVARRSHRILTEDFGVPEEDLVFDPLVFPCGTGDTSYLGSAKATIEGVRAVKQAFPRCKTVLGISNVSFGLPESGREVLNSVFLHHCVSAGLDLAIVNSERLERYPSISADDRRACEDLLFLRGDDPVAAFAAHFRARGEEAGGAGGARAGRAKPGGPGDDLPLEQRIARYVVEGTKQGLVPDLELARKDPRWPTALDIVNGPLMAGMAEVGRLFNANELIVAEVLQSAEAMKAAVTHLEPYMPKEDSASRGKVLLATVKGDVHDIGKNLVDIVLTNNGFQVVNLGIKVASEVLIEAVRTHRPDLIGLSGLLVKSAQMMVSTAEDLAAAGIDLPLLVGGAALSPAFTYRRIAAQHAGPVAYAKDAMTGLALAQRFCDASQRPALERELLEARARVAQAPAAEAPKACRPAGVRSSHVRQDVERPRTPPLEPQVLLNVDLDQVWAWLNPQMLYGKHLGLRGHVPTLLAEGDEKAAKLAETIRGLQDQARGGWMHVRACFRFFPVRAEGDAIVVLDPEDLRERERFVLPRQTKGEGLCLADYVVPGPDGIDHVGLFVTTAGEGVRERVEALKAAGRYLESHAYGSLAVETAEAAAEWLHARLRALWGFPDPATLTPEAAFRCDYRGKRYSFGYPACPDLADQAGLFRLLEPESIGVTLTEGFMMDPEASVSALVFHHPDARYFAAASREDPLPG
jgi:5-methyltetrahydrofolate--homocysteine methyltransferase